MRPFFLITVLLLLSIACSDRYPTEPLRVAFMADVHFHDVFADLGDAFEGLPTKVNVNGLPTIERGEIRGSAIRSMNAQLNSTRLFNENYFAFVAALEDVRARGIQLVVLPGDFSDDGQPAHLAGLAEIMDYYRDNHGIRFFISPGNHDPSRPFTRENGKSDYLGTEGREQPIFSTGHRRCTDKDGFRQTTAAGTESDNSTSPTSNIGTPVSHKVVCTDKVQELGYEGLLEHMGNHGPIPYKGLQYFETPFSSYDPLDYQFHRALEEAAFHHRQYEICREGSGGRYRQEHYTLCFEVMDMSYLAEPVDGLWLLSIDGNVHLPRADADPNRPDLAANFDASGNAGYNRVVSHKQHLIDWIEDVAFRADELGKTLIAFSHFPAVDFYNKAQDGIEALWGEGNFQLRRIPTDRTSKRLAATGLNLHVGGHMHMNDTELIRDPATGNTLINIQTPSLAAYVPAYKILNIYNRENRVEVKTAILEEVHGFDTLFPHYLEEWEYLNKIGYSEIWSREILDVSNYYEFTDWHMRELSRLRFLPQEWPEELRAMLTRMNGRDMLLASKLQSSLSFETFMNNAEDHKSDRAGRTGQFGSDAAQSDESLPIGGAKERPVGINPARFDAEFQQAWIKAEKKAKHFAGVMGLELDDFAGWDGLNLSVDFYRLRNADELALRDIKPERMAQYATIAAALDEARRGINRNATNPDRFDHLFQNRFHTVFEVMHRFVNGLPSDHFEVDLTSGTVKSKKRNKH